MRLGDRTDAITLFERVLLMHIEDGNAGVQILTDLRNLATSCSKAVRFCLDEVTRVATELLGDAEDGFLYSQSLLDKRLSIGDLAGAEREWAEIEKLPRPTSRLTYRPGDAECSGAWLLLYQGRLSEAFLESAERIAIEGNNRFSMRELCALRGEWKLSLGESAEAADAFEEYIRMTREADIDASREEALLAIAQSGMGRTDQAREAAERLSALGNPPHVVLAEVFLALGDVEKARHRVIPGYDAAWGEGAPYVHWWDLQRCRKVLAALGDPEPVLAPFDPSTIKPFSWDPKLREYLEKVRKEKEKEQREQAGSAE